MPRSLLPPLLPLARQDNVRRQPRCSGALGDTQPRTRQGSARAPRCSEPAAASVFRRVTEPKETIDLFGRRAGSPEPSVERSFPSAFQVAHERRRTYVLRPCPIDNETEDLDVLADESTRWTHTINAAVDSIGRLFIERFRRAA